MFLPSLGFTLLSLSQLGGADFSEQLLTAQLQWIKSFGRISLETTGSFSVLPLSSNQVNINARVLSGAFLIGFQFKPSVPWQITLKAGGIYSTMFVTNDAFGYKNLAGEQVVFRLDRLLGSALLVGSDVKYAPVISSSGFGFSDYDVEAGLDLTFFIKSHPIKFGYELNRLQVASVVSPLTMLTQGFSLTFGF